MDSPNSASLVTSHARITKSARMQYDLMEAKEPEMHIAVVFQYIDLDGGLKSAKSTAF